MKVGQMKAISGVPVCIQRSASASRRFIPPPSITLIVKLPPENAATLAAKVRIWADSGRVGA
jgi:hypothetical protein